MQEKYPLLIDRIQATFIDMILIIILMIICTSILDRFEHVQDWVTKVMCGVIVLYEPIFMAMGGTLGNYLKGIRVRKVSDTTKRINIFQSIGRYPVKLFLGWISFLTISGNTKRRAIHDLVSGTVMIKL